MTRYIDADEYYDELLKMESDISFSKQEINGIRNAIASLQAQPTADVQPVVHCVKCKYRDKMEFCILNDIFINEKDFCSKGDKLDGDEHDNG